MQFIDTNIFLRFLTKDVPAKAERVKSLLEQAERGEIELLTSETVISELVFVLSSPRIYELSREAVRMALLPIVSLKGLRLPNRSMLVRALDLYATTSIDFVDALAVAQMERRKITDIYSYDEHFDRMANIKRLEP